MAHIPGNGRLGFFLRRLLNGPTALAVIDRRRVDVDDHRGGGLQLLQRAGKSLDADNVRVPD